MFNKLSNTPVAQNAVEIFASVEAGRVTLLEGYTGSGKSLVSPLAVWQKFREPVLVLVPSVDVARDNASRVAKLADADWQLGHEVGCVAGGRHMWGSCVVFATYGSYLAHKKLQDKQWAAILLDESHTEQWQVEVCRADVYDRLERNEALAVMELTATMDRQKLENYWRSGGVKVAHHLIEGVEPPFQRELVHVHPAYNEGLSRTCAKETKARIEAGDRLIMLVQPGMAEVEKASDDLKGMLKGSPYAVDVFTYHGDTDAEVVRTMLSRLEGDEVRVIVTTPRLLTGFNHEDLDTVVTCGRAKYPYSDTNGAFMLKRESMSQAELRQAMGRVGRFKNGRLVLCSDVGFESRHAVVKPEVERMNSVPLALALMHLGRDPLSIKFCNTPRDLPGAVAQLKQWGFVDHEGLITNMGVQAHKLDIRPDLAHFLLCAMADKNLSTKCKAAAVIMTAVEEGNGVCAINPRDEQGYAVQKPRLDLTSDLFNEVLRFAEAAKMGKQRQKEALWLSRRGFARCKAIISRLLADLQHREVTTWFGNIFADDKAKELEGKGAKHQAVQESPKQRAWRIVGQKLQNLTDVRANVVRLLVETMQEKLYVIQNGGRRGWMGRNIKGEEFNLGHESAVQLGEGDLILANQRVIVPRNGGRAFTILNDATKVSMVDLVEACSERFRMTTERKVTGFYQFVEETVLLENDAAILRTSKPSPLTSEEEAEKAAFEAARDPLQARLEDLAEVRSQLGLETIRCGDTNWQIGSYGSSREYTEELVAEVEDRMNAIVLECKPHLDAVSEARAEVELNAVHYTDDGFKFGAYGETYAYTAEGIAKAKQDNATAIAEKQEADAEAARKAALRAENAEAGKARIESLNVRRAALGMEATTIDSDDEFYRGRYVHVSELDVITEMEAEVAEKEEALKAEALEAQRRAEEARRARAAQPSALEALAAHFNG